MAPNIKTFIDLFCGIGGFRLALERRGLECVFSSDIDKHARSAYASNFGDEPAGDITKVDAKDIPPHDLIVGGFPCQSFSIAGRRDPLKDDRTQLFYEIVRIAKHHRPKVVLLENVQHILKIQDGYVMDMFVKAWNSIGYNVSHHLLNASDYGIPQTRRRVYFTIIRNDVALKSLAPEPTKEGIYVCGILDPEADNDPKLRIPARHGLATARQRRNRKQAGHYRFKRELFVSHANGSIRIGGIGDVEYKGSYNQSYRIYSIHGPFTDNFNL